jgi:hypothetical protein
MTAFCGLRKLRWNKEAGPCVGLSMEMKRASMPESPSRALARRTAATVCLGATSLGFVWLSTQERVFQSATWGLLGMATLTMFGAGMLLASSLRAQVFGRAVAWVVFLPSVASLLAELLASGRAELAELPFAAASGLALLLGYPSLTSPEARREFAPVAYRRSFLSGAIASATAGIVAALVAAGDLLLGGGRHEMAVFTTLAAVLLTTSWGVMRMRAWGVLLGASTSLVMVGAAVLSRNEWSGLAYGLAGLPGLMLTLPLLMARLRPAETAPSHAFAAPAGAAVRVRAAEKPVEPNEVLVRVAVSEQEWDEAPFASQPRVSRTEA